MIEEWVRVRQFLLPALELTGGTHTEDDIVTGLLVGQVDVNAPRAMKLWTAEKSAIVTEFLHYPRLKFIHFFLVGGDMAEVLAMETPILEWAKAHGCHKKSCAGRKGWERVLKGYDKSFLVMHGNI